MKWRLTGLVLGCAFVANASAQTPLAQSYDATRRALKTDAVAAPSPQDFDKKTPKGIETIRYTSKTGELLAWVIQPSTKTIGPRPVVVYQHGGFALGKGDDTDAKPFADAGYIVMLPALRGENGNPGNFELFLGEVDDVIAAGRKAKTLPGADPNRVYLFGHSIGGGLATLVSLSRENPFKLIGTTGGNYPLQDCAGIAKDWGTFDPTKRGECAARFPDPYLASLDVPLLAFVGDQDKYALAVGNYFRTLANANYQLRILTGVDHFSAVKPSIKAFIAEASK